MSSNDIKITNSLKATIRAPKEAYFFFPKFTEEIDWNALYPYKTRRFIFEKLSITHYLPFEIEKYEELKSSPLFTSICLPSTWNQAMLLKCIQASKYNIPKTIALITKLISFKMPELAYDSYKEILQSGFVYLHGLDSNFRPIIVTNASVYMELNKRYSYEHFICAIDYFINYLFENIFIHGQVENWVMIADVNDITMLKPPISLMNVFSFISMKYLCRLSTLYIFGMSSLLNICWSVINKFLDEGTVKKFVFVNEKNKEEILRHVHPSQLEIKYGGECPNRTEYSETFYLPSEDYLSEEMKQLKHLVSEEEYIERSLDGMLIDISPYLREDIDNRRQLNHTVYSVALTKINCNDIVSESNMEVEERSIILLHADDYDDKDIVNKKRNAADDDPIKEENKDKEKEEVKSVNNFKAKDEDYDTADLSISNSNIIISAKKGKRKGGMMNKNMITIFESKEETSSCCYNNQTKGLCSCIIM